MADTIISDAVVGIQDEGLPNISDGNEDWGSAGLRMMLAQAVDSDSYVRSDSELTFTNHDGTNDQVDVTGGVAYLDLTGETVNVQSGLGGSSPPSYDTALPTLPAIPVIAPTTTADLAVQDSTLSSVWIAYATDSSVSGISPGDIYLRSDDTGSVSTPPHPNAEIGQANPDDASADTLLNRFGSPTFADLDVGSVSTGRVGPNQGGTRWATDFASIQAALDDIPSAPVKSGGANQSLGKVYLPPKENGYDESVDLDDAGMILEGAGINTYIYGTGDHLIDCQQNDQHIEGFWAEQTGSGSYDAVRATGNEWSINNAAVDIAPRYGFYVGGRDATVGPHVFAKGGDSSCFYLDADHIGLHGVKSVNAPSDVLTLSSDCSWSQCSLRVKDAGGSAVVLNGSDNFVNVTSVNHTDHAVDIQAAQNVVCVNSYASAGNEDVYVNSDSNYIYGRIAGDVTFASGTTNNKISAVVQGTVSDPDGNNDTTDVQ